MTAQLSLKLDRVGSAARARVEKVTRKLPPIERLHEFLRIDIDTGRLFWRVRAARRIQIGDMAGCFDDQGYRRVLFGGKKIREHRIVFAMTHGRWPVNQIDHINCIKSDNRPCNLREATQSQNQANTPVYASNTSGFKGVYWKKETRKWVASIGYNGKRYHLGYFVDLNAAAAAYANATAIFFGNFARIDHKHALATGSRHD